MCSAGYSAHGILERMRPALAWVFYRGQVRLSLQGPAMGTSVWVAWCIPTLKVPRWARPLVSQGFVSIEES